MGVPAAPIRNENPRKITWADTEAGDSSSLPRSFLENLQKVMNKKWQVAEKCQANVEMTPLSISRTALLKSGNSHRNSIIYSSSNSKCNNSRSSFSSSNSTNSSFSSNSSSIY